MVARTKPSPADTRTEIAIVGGGLAGGLIALALRRLRPEIPVMLIEQGEVLGGNHRWSWFASDLAAPESAALMAGFRTAEWQGYEVRFPAYARQLGSQYRSLASSDFDASLRRELSQATIHTGRGVTALDAQGVTLDGGERISARMVIDCRGAVTSEHFRGGWQVFMGRHIRTRQPHGVARPTIMDAAVRQHGAFRFVYTLPLGANDLFIEDTYYADDPVLDRGALSTRIDAYTQEQGWGAAGSDDFEIVGHEAGVLPVITGGSFADYQADQRVDGVVMAGARGGFVHPLTSYTLPFAVETALAIAADADLPGAQMAALIEQRARRHWSRTRYYRMLGSMLFGAAEPDLRYRIFEHFYRLDEDLVERFYAARSTLPDKARILIGKPPVPVSKAIQALITPGRPLAAPQETRT
ncbi:lycopene beta-cyclase CrtY [Altererythrobacter sediminis]|uniref:Lycopene beta-cyclase CrtY n=2 Tax=Allopontixanthobacter sediminis TaxID=1689985 RepID=A0A845B4K4_9SPHN|nr:lycopene beta-cyclase CrtY [Allopontixanthobacter sediminis]